MNKTIWSYPGSRWWKFDFHAHTPASRDTYWARHNIDLSPEDWLLRYMAAEIDCVAVTDHNNGEWVDSLKDAYVRMKEQADAGSPPEGFRELTIFPGVEISVNGGIHVLAIFDPTANTTTITSLLGAVGFPTGRHGHTDSVDNAAVTRASIVEVLEEVIRAGGIPIPAHADDPKGLLQCRAGSNGPVLDANTLRQALAVEGLIAVEWCDRSKNFPDCVRKDEPRFTKVLGSDCHSFQGTKVPGSAYTWVKMAMPTLEGLRLALLDGNDVSIRRSDEGGFEPFKLPAHRIRLIEINKACYMGNGQSACIACSPYFNAIVGGRGTGKSTIVQALRLALARGDELKRLAEDAEPRKRFDDFCKVAKGRDSIGALRDDTELRVEWECEDLRYRLVWRPANGVTVQEPDDLGDWQTSASQQNVIERFPIRTFSQGQIAAMAGSGRQALLTLIDEAAQVGKFKQAFEEAKRTFLTRRARLRELEGKLADRYEVERRLHEVGRKLDAFSQAHHAEVLKAHARAQDQRREVEQLLEQMRALPGRIEETAQGLILDDWPSGVFDDAGDADVLQWRKKANDAVQQARQALEQASRALDESAQLLEQDPLLAAWRERTDKARADFDALQQDLAAQGVHDPQAFAQLVQHRQYLEEQLKYLDRIKAERDTLEEEIAAQWKKIVEAREAITSARAEFVKKTLDGNPYVRIEVVPFGFDPRVIERSLRELLEATDDRFENDILATDAAGNPTGGLALEIAHADDSKAALDSSKKQLQTIADAFGGHFKNYLKKKLERPEFADHIQCWFPEDDLRIEYSRKADGTDWAAITQGSQGQRSAALLAFLLAFGDEPLILDQPEDDLDNHLIYDLIVRQIRQNKLRRQLIVVTHNPNIVVNGDAELVHVMEFGQGQCFVRQSGALQEIDVREEVCRVMEGGRDAFERRWKRLGRSISP
jgi:energy-coupling factor transporter ATP-binding protein EcfA2